MHRLRGFYAVLDRDDEALARKLLAVARVLQVRVKPAAPSDVARIARMARRVCDEVGAALIVNDRIDVALAVGADGVHLGQTDIAIDDARAIVGDGMWIGVSTHDVEQVARAVARGASYLGFGPMFATRTKHNPDPQQGLAGLRAAVAAAHGTPIVAIGGISAADVAAIYAAGATAICAIHAVNEAPDVTFAARAMSHTG